ncbi:MAG TPA: MarR family transcriptional regulator [Mycobacteriales bacterium]|nr:MarR family transcriptional regulator [Mycobacteriales bacterium]
MTRALVGISLESMDPLEGRVTIPQFRILLALEGSGPVPSSVLAERLGAQASSITRLVDRLQAENLVTRGADERSRSIVTVEITASGRTLVTRVLDARHQLIAATLAELSPEDRTALIRGADAFTAASGHALSLGPTGPLPL